MAIGSEKHEARINARPISMQLKAVMKTMPSEQGYYQSVCRPCFLKLGASLRIEIYQEI